MSLQTAANLSIILLALEGFVIALPLGVALYYALRGLRQGRMWMRNVGLPQGQRYAAMTADAAQKVSQKVTDPLMQVEEAKAAGLAGAGTLPAALRRRKRR